MIVKQFKTATGLQVTHIKKGNLISVEVEKMNINKLNKYNKWLTKLTSMLYLQGITKTTTQM